ncbi:hypothetical protein J6590_104602, partial [Homalodisca vitripennis]
FSSGSGEEFQTDPDDLGTASSDEETNNVHRPSTSRACNPRRRPRQRQVAGLIEPWIRAYHPEPEKNIKRRNRLPGNDANWLIFLNQNVPHNKHIENKIDDFVELRNTSSYDYGEEELISKIM